MKTIHPKTSVIKAKVLIFVLSLLFTASFSLVTKAQDEDKTQDEDKITIEHNLPKFVPLKVELFNLDSEDVLRDFEVKITNTGEMPIYSLRYALRSVDVKISGAPITYTFEYGRKALNGGANESEENKVRITDKPINPGKSITFKLPEITVYVSKKNVELGMNPKIKIYELDFIDLIYADRTGFTKGGFFSPKKLDLIFRVLSRIFHTRVQINLSGGNMNNHKLKLTTTGKIFLTIFSSVLFLTCFALSGYSQDESVSVAVAEDENKITIRHSLPKFVPLKVELTGLDSADVLRGFQAKITNTGEKPIYHLRFDFQIGDVKMGDISIVLQSFEFGRHALGGGANESTENKIRTTDEPINPGESIILKLSEITVDVHRKNIELGMYPKPRIYEMDFVDLTYADRSGFTRRGIFPILKTLKKANL
jgi:hypothetical protein